MLYHTTRFYVERTQNAGLHLFCCRPRPFLTQAYNKINLFIQFYPYIKHFSR